MRFKKILSVFLAVLMIFSISSLGLTGVAAEIDYDAQYRALANALQNEHVRELTNYTISSTTLDNGTEGFDTEARAFAYDHRVYAKDNAAGDILKASNRFYYIAESIMSYTYGVGCYDADTLVSYVLEKIKPYFASTTGEKIYEDFYGDRYYPSDEELTAYNNAVSIIQAVGGTISQATLTEQGIYFIEMDDWEYYNVETVLKYFVGNVLKVNTGNWYHRFSFIVETSIDTILEESNGIDGISSYVLTLRTAVYQFEYKKVYNESASKAYFSFDEPSLERVWENYAAEYGFDSVSADLTVRDENNLPGLLREGQASAYMIKIDYDTTTVPYIVSAYNAFHPYVSQSYNASTGAKWDSQFVTLTDAQITNTADGVADDAPVILGYAATLSTELSNESLIALFGEELGNMVTLAYLYKTSRSAPTRTVRGTATYTATADRLNDIIWDLDALISPRESESANDIKTANRVATVVKQFLDIGGMLGTENPIEYDTLEDLVGKVLQELVFSDSIVNMLVEMLYPMIVTLLEDNIGSISLVGGTIMSILDSILDDNDLAIYPNTLADLLVQDYGSKYSIPAQILKNAGSSWDAVNFDGIKWGVDEAPVESKADVFLDALCAGLSGFTRILVCLLCGDAEYENDERQSLANANFGKLYDLQLISGTFLVSQGLYTKVFVPLYRVLGVPETVMGTDASGNEYVISQGLFLTSKQYHDAIDTDYKTCLRNAVEPLIKWITECVAKRPFQTIMELLPNLVYFLSREDNLSASDKERLSECQEYWADPDFISEQVEAHEGFSLVQTMNLKGILENVYINISLAGQAIAIGSIASLIGDDTLGMLGSLNSLLNELISFSYDTDEIYPENIACYYNDAGEIVLPGSTEYALNPGNYPHAAFTYYSDSSNTQFSLTKDDAHPFEQKNITYVQKDYYIPAIPEAKLISCGEVYNPTTHNTIKVDNPGLVFLFLLRYIFSALGYKYDLNDSTLPTLIECLGIDLSGELFMGLSLGDIIYNIMIHPDEAICAVLELFYSNEVGDEYKDIDYTYPIDKINYRETTLLNPLINPTFRYGTDVKYSQYWTKEYANDFVSNLAPLAEDVLIMLGMEGMEDGIGPFLKNMLNENVFNNDLCNMLFNMIYQLLGGLNESIGFDIEAVLYAVLDVSFTPDTVSKSLVKIIGHDTPASRAIGAVETWTELFDGGVEVDPVTGKETQIIVDVDLDWGIEEAEEHGHSRADSFLKTVSALLAPASFLIKFLFMDMDLSILGLINLPGYAGYQYAFIALLEALSCPNILTYDDYYEASLDPECGDANTIYYLFSPLLGLLDKVYADPVNVLLSLIPNLLFFISIGGLNGLINNLIHFVYVLLDVLKPVINAYDLLDGLLSNIDLGGLSLNLTLPLDIDFNSLISDLLGTVLGDALTIGDVSLKLPYIDLYTLCVGTLEKFNSKEVRSTVYLNAAGGGELLTALLRIVFEVLFMDENHKALSQIIANLAEEGRLDAYDEETLSLVVAGLFDLLEENHILDMVLYAVYMLITYLVPVADTLAPRFQANNMTITDLIDSAEDQDAFMANLQLLLKDPNEVETPGESSNVNALGGLFERIKALFERIRLFFEQLFNFG